MDMSSSALSSTLPDTSCPNQSLTILPFLTISVAGWICPAPSSSVRIRRDTEVGRTFTRAEKLNCAEQYQVLPDGYAQLSIQFNSFRHQLSKSELDNTSIQWKYCRNTWYREEVPHDTRYSLMDMSRSVPSSTPHDTVCRNRSLTITSISHNLSYCRARISSSVPSSTPPDTSCQNRDPAILLFLTISAIARCIFPARCPVQLLSSPIVGIGARQYFHFSPSQLWPDAYFLLDA